MKKASGFLALGLTLISATSALAVPTLSALTTFGGTDGWRAPKELVTGDVAGTTYNAGASYTYLGVGNGERGIAYNPVTGNLLLVSRPTTDGSLTGTGTAPAVRVLNGSTGADLGGFNLTGVTGGNGALLNKIGVTGDGNVYASNITLNIGTTAFKVYNWASENAGLTTGGNAAPSTFFNNTITGYAGTPRAGDVVDFTGANAASVAVAAGTLASNGYSIVNSTGGYAVATITPNTSPTGPISASFSRGITFAGNSNTVWGKGSESILWETTYTTGTAPAATGTRTGAPALTLNRQPMDYFEIEGVPYLAVMDIATAAGTTSSANKAIVYVYNMTNPAVPVQVASASTIPDGLSVVAAIANSTAPLSTAGGNGQVAWGATTYSGGQAITTLYALGTNQGIQALTFSVDAVPEASSFAAIGMVGLVAGAAKWYRRRRAA